MQRIFLIILILIQYYGFSQTTFNYGVGIGISSSHLLKNNEYFSGLEKSNIESTPLISPIFGSYFHLISKKHYQFTIGLCFNQIGTKYHNYIEGTVLNDDTVYYTFKQE